MTKVTMNWKNKLASATSQRRVWSLIARSGVQHTNYSATPPPIPGCVSQVPKTVRGSFQRIFWFPKSVAPDFSRYFRWSFRDLWREESRASIFQPVNGSKIAIDTAALGWFSRIRNKLKTFSMNRLQNFISSDLYILCQAVKAAWCSVFASV